MFTSSLDLYRCYVYWRLSKKTQKLKMRLLPVRAELSIIACILTVGHIALYLSVYAPLVFSGGSSGGDVAITFAVDLVLFVLLVLLGATSIRLMFVR